MKTHSEKMKVSLLSLAVQGALAAMCAVPAMALAADDEAAAFTQPSNFVEAGVANVSQKSAKFGEYNGLNENGAVFIGNFGIGGGSAYDAYNDGNGTLRWEINGNDLGTTSRSLNGSVGNQGRWSVNVGYDELRHNISDSYQTPQQGSMGGGNFTMPANFGTINGAAAPSARTLNASQLSAFHTEDVGSTRKNTSFGAGFNFNQQWSLKFDYNHLDQSGAKLLAAATQGAIGVGGTPATTGRAEAVNILMNPTNYTTDTFNLALNWVGEKGYMTSGYYGSVFRDGYNNLTWQNAIVNSTSVGAGFSTDAMSTAPGNSLHQLNLTGGYVFTPSTKLVGGFSYGRNMQNDSYTATSIMQTTGTAFNTMQPNGLPQSSLNGVVVTTHADLKLTNQTTKDLMLSAGFKYNERDNQTGSSTYKYYNLGGNTTAGQIYTGVNTPYSNRKTQFEAAADYRIDKGQSLRLAYEREDIKRWCNSVVGGAECVASPSSGEDKLGLTYRLKAGDSIRLNAGYAFADRSSEFNHNYRSNVGNYGVGTVNSGDYYGFLAYPYAGRKQNILKAGVNWQATEQLDVGLMGRYSQDKYSTTLGVQDGDTSSVNLDATYSFSEVSSVSAYFSWQTGTRNLRDGGSGSGASITVAPVNVWTNQLNQDSSGFGLNAKHAGLMGGKLELMGDLSYSYDKSGYSTQVPYLATCGAATVLTCGSTPDIKAVLVTMKLTGSYKIDKHSKLALAYLYQNLKSNDFYYNAYQYGYTPNRVMPTNEQAPNYSVNVLAATYTYSF